jgi:predicted nucleic acid-binding Zn ribbon protein
VRDMRGKASLTPVGDVLPRVLEELGLRQRLAERRVLESWAKIVGEKIARHSRVVDIQDGVLTLQADHGVWRQELSLLTPEIVRRYNEVCGEGTVREIRWDRRLPRRPYSDNQA